VEFSWSYTPTFCPSLTFSILDSSNNPVSPSYLTLGSNKLNVLSNSQGDIGTHTLKLRGTLGAYTYSDLALSVTITDSCVAVTILTSSITNMEKDIADPSAVT
jgi:hypothetical protein